jgi:Fe-S cluster biogenesis protein NfuA
MELQGRVIPREEVEAVLDGLRPALVADGGNVELVEIEADGTVRVSMQGLCAECPAQATTVRLGLEEPLREALPGISAVIPV